MIKIWLKFVSKGLINNIPALVQIMAWRRLGAKPLSEPMMFSLLMHICVTWPQWVNSLAPERCGSSYIQVHFSNSLNGKKPLPEPMLTQISVAIWHHQATRTRRSWYSAWWTILLLICDIFGHNALMIDDLCAIDTWYESKIYLFKHLTVKGHVWVMGDSAYMIN